MKKYRFKETKEEIELGEYVEIHALLDEESAPQLVEAGILEEYEAITVEDVIEHIAQRTEEKYDEVEEHLLFVGGINLKALFSVVLKEVALMLDDKYKGHIKYSKELWGIENITGEVFLITNNKEEIFNAPFDKIAAFRSKEDAEKAVEILKDIYEVLYGK